METDNTNSDDYKFSNNVNVYELDDETNIKLRGDAIGDTSYSQSFVLKTLLQFSDLKWSEEVEEDLCFLWDMTVEKDVCKYLFEISFPSIACSALEKYSEHRFIEIVIGILANILCADCTEKNITQDEVNIVLNELNTDDHLVLIQVVRFISVLVPSFNNIHFVNDNLLDKFLFILCNSTNTDLLIKTLETISKVTNDFKLGENVISIEIVKSTLTAYKFVVNELDEFGLDTEDKRLSCKYMLKIIFNFCSYIDQYDNKNLLLQFKNCSNIFLNEIIKILDCYSHEENLLPITEEFIFYMSVLTYILETLNINYLSNIFLPLTKILYIVSEIKNEVSDLFDTIIELECFLFSRSTSDVLSKDLKSLPKNKIKTVLTVIKENEYKCNFDPNLQCVLDNFK